MLLLPSAADSLGKCWPAKTRCVIAEGVLASLPVSPILGNNCCSVMNEAIFLIVHRGKTMQLKVYFVAKKIKIYAYASVICIFHAFFWRWYMEFKHILHQNRLVFAFHFPWLFGNMLMCLSFLRFFLGELWLSGHNRGKFSRLRFPWRWIQLTGKTRVSKTACTTCETPGREEPSNNYLEFRVSETIRGALCTVYLHHLNAGQFKSLLLKYSYSSKQPTYRGPSYSQFWSLGFKSFIFFFL